MSLCQTDQKEKKILATAVTRTSFRLTRSESKKIVLHLVYIPQKNFKQETKGLES